MMTFIGFLLLLTVPSAVEARMEYQSQIPNGANVMRNGVAWPGVGHNAQQGSGSRNPFGAAFESAGFLWTRSLCRADSDSDGQSNGFELGDPNCTWSRGSVPNRTSDISHPGFSDSVSTFGLLTRTIALEDPASIARRRQDRLDAQADGRRAWVLGIVIPFVVYLITAWFFSRWVVGIPYRNLSAG